MEKIVEQLEKEGFFQHNGYSVVEISKEKVVLKAELTKKSMNPYGIAHGGFIFGLGDTAMGILVKMNGEKAVTLNANIDYLRPGIGNYIIATAELVKNGKTICVVKSNIYNDQEKLIATMNSNKYRN